jgi:DNA repair protein RadC
MGDNLLPREKMELHGEEFLVDSELIALILRSGVKGASVFEISENLINQYKTFPNLHKQSIEKIMEVKGVGKIGAINLKAALEMGKRFHVQKQREETQKVKKPEDVYRFCEDMIHYSQEIVRVIYLDSKLNIINFDDITIGTANASLAHPRDIFKNAIKNNSISIIMIHNHPSGDPSPSIQDIELTEKIKQAGKILDINLNDHLIIGKGSFYSFSLSRRVNL